MTEIIFPAKDRSEAMRCVLLVTQGFPVQHCCRGEKKNLSLLQFFDMINKAHFHPHLFLFPICCNACQEQ